MTNTERNKLIKAAQNGNAEAFGKLYEELAAELYRFALWYLKNPENAEDAVQEACLNAFRNIGRLKKPASFKSWFMRILANCCKDVVSSRSRLHLVGEDDAELQTAAYYENYSDGSVERMLDTLGSPDRDIVLLCVLGDYKSTEVGKMLHMSSAAVRKRLSRALHTLRDQLEAET